MRLWLRKVHPLSSQKHGVFVCVYLCGKAYVQNMYACVRIMISELTDIKDWIERHHQTFHRHSRGGSQIASGKWLVCMCGLKVVRVAMLPSVRISRLDFVRKLGGPKLTTDCDNLLAQSQGTPKICFSDSLPFAVKRKIVWEKIPGEVSFSQVSLTACQIPCQNLSRMAPEHRPTCEPSCSWTHVAWPARCSAIFAAATCDLRCLQDGLKTRNP